MTVEEENKKLKAQVAQLKKEWEDSCNLLADVKLSRKNLLAITKRLAMYVDVEAVPANEPAFKLIQDWNKFRTENKWT